ncbi:Release factor glutamine methyltransferase,N5-glutamine S-adenosyl-L-methionine-dependent methyltransferase,Methylase of polypeptide chain release factors,protein-(glutamine-N5) methyltransferase, release factor-specific,Methyltransferase small domain [Chlamydia serpentis]|uniref:peptide chain release factor N(5)-glutamine methyltransferase n=1 Tax=Chlamydia serpentis TaxID=1967782 RepID=A0A2R8FA26_9CHLA|nr:peptide chain release factor N(5)-glutamine methyltransferase [Chlamydia serpentis]SPN73280.1 Release factor glutamine methyltransferase,N5-glutamine S-adenosyl-L-methionine-dependent methyltransferase,Methylase of polypeptide chain release factors,protein-(glutamine-N5) methyltransferase, release factor-specific,Methyltransferase small domain [Chlamydia serpentis]
MEIKKVIEEGIAYLDYYGVPLSHSEALYILMDLLGLSSRAKLLDLFEINASMLHEYQNRLVIRARRYPTAYLHGKTNFLGLTLNVDSRVLIPRAETELLAEYIIKYLMLHSEIQTFYDICCGSGCLGLAIKKYCPHVDVVLSDICPKAIAVAKINAESHGLDVKILLGDLFAPYDSPADAFVCNPPYLSFNEIIRTDPEVRCYEPWKALIGGPTGLEFYERIAQELFKILIPKGVGWLEIGYNQGKSVQNIFLKKGIGGRIYQDLSGHDRIFFLEMDPRDPVSSTIYS